MPRSSGGESLKPRYHRYFAQQERGRLGAPRFPAHFAAAPDVIISLTRIADDLANTPRDETRDPEALMASKSNAARRIKTLVQQIEVIQPIITRSAAAPRMARIAPKIARPERQPPAGQMALFVDLPGM